MINGYDKFWETVERRGEGKRPESQQQDKKIPGSDIFWETVGLEAPSTQPYPQQSGIEYIDSKLKEYGQDKPAGTAAESACDGAVRL